MRATFRCCKRTSRRCKPALPIYLSVYRRRLTGSHQVVGLGKPARPAIPRVPVDVRALFITLRWLTASTTGPISLFHSASFLCNVHPDYLIYTPRVHTPARMPLSQSGCNLPPRRLRPLLKPSARRDEHPTMRTSPPAPNLYNATLASRSDQAMYETHMKRI